MGRGLATAESMAATRARKASGHAVDCGPLGPGAPISLWKFSRKLSVENSSPSFTGSAAGTLSGGEA
eukprot:6787320-Prymnesium_polylepis.1